MSENKDKKPKQYIMNFLSDTINLYNSYHNHKELSAWGALVLYIILIMGIISAIEPTEAYKILAIAFIVILGTIIHCFICIQFKGRRIAANIVSACQVLTREYLLKKVKNDIEEEIKWRKPDKPKDCNSEFMAYYYLPKNIVDEAKKISKNEDAQQARKCLEYLVQLLLILACIAAIFIIYCKTPESKGILNIIQ